MPQSQKAATPPTLTLRDPRTGRTAELPILHGTQGPPAVDLSNLHAATGLFTYDPGFCNTAAYKSSITFVDGETGVLQYRGYDVTWLVEHCDYLDTAYLLLHGDLPLRGQRKEFTRQVRNHSLVEEHLTRLLEGFRHDAQPMAIMVGAVGALSAFYATPLDTPAQRAALAVTILAKIPTVAAWAFRYSRGLPFVYPRDDLTFPENLLHMFFASALEPYTVDPVHAKALEAYLILYADHEQTASTTTVRNAGSSQANPFACIAAGIASLWGPAERAAEAVLEMLAAVGDKARIPEFLARAKDPADPFRLAGFGHWVYKTYDPRAIVFRRLCHEVLTHNKADTALLQLALDFEQAVLQDDHFRARRLFPNGDYYSGILLTALGFPPSMFAVMFTVSRSLGWIAN